MGSRSIQFMGSNFPCCDYVNFNGLRRYVCDTSVLPWGIFPRGVFPRGTGVLPRGVFPMGLALEIHQYNSVICMIFCYIIAGALLTKVLMMFYNIRQYLRYYYSYYHLNPILSNIYLLTRLLLTPFLLPSYLTLTLSLSAVSTLSSSPTSIS